MVQYPANHQVRVIAQDGDDSAARVGDIGTVIGHKESEYGVLVQFDGFTEWLWNGEVELVAAIPNRANAMSTKALNEPVLPDDYPVYGNYLYIADGKLIMSDWHDITVRQFKAQLGAKEIRRCDMHGRAALTPHTQDEEAGK